MNNEETDISEINYEECTFLATKGGGMDVGNLNFYKLLLRSANFILTVKIAGRTMNSEYGRLSLEGSAILSNSELKVELIPPIGSTVPFSPVLGDSFEIIVVLGTISGKFKKRSMPTLAAGLAWNKEEDCIVSAGSKQKYVLKVVKASV